MTASILPPNTLPNGGTLVFHAKEEQQVYEALHTLTPRRVRRALAAYNEERKHVEPAKATPFLKHVGNDLDKRGLNAVQIQLINVTAAQQWGWFKTFLNRWIMREERSNG